MAARSLRESIGTAFVATNLTPANDGETGSLELIVASAWTGDRLGRLLARLKYGGDTSTLALRKATWLIVDRMVPRGKFGKKAPTDALILMCGAALVEWMTDRCPPPCTAGWLRLDATPRTCPRCNGLGTVAQTDEQRLKACDGQYDVRVYDKILRKLQEADSRHNRQARRAIG